jgi:uncharacterized membrane protein YidH (DUF202 family)
MCGILAAVDARTFLAWSRTGLAFVGVGIGMDLGLTHDRVLMIANNITIYQTQCSYHSSYFSNSSYENGFIMGE